MFFSENELLLEMLGVFKISRTAAKNESNDSRIYDSLSIRTSGRGHFKTAEASYTAKKGDLLYIPKTECYSQTTTGETIYAIHFINYSFNKKNKMEILSINDIEYIENLIKEMYNVWKEKNQGYKYKCTALLYTLLHVINCQILDSAISSITHDDKIKNAVSYIHSNFRNTQIPVSHLAKMCFISETYFRKLFKQIYAISPSQYIINLKLEYASQLLLSHLYTISQVSERCGFTDTKYFSKLFKKHYNYSPKEYQKLNPETFYK